MNKRRSYLLAAALVAVIGGYGELGAQQRRPPNPADVFIAEDTDGFDPGLAIGERFPSIHALYEGEEIVDVGGFAQENGLIFVANRSVDWCPYCRMQIAELNEHAAAFEDAGIGIVIVTYDSPELQQAFIDAGSIAMPFVSDIDAATVKALGILNENYSPGDSAYGIPHPGVFVLNPDLEIVGKIFVDSFRSRVEGRGTLEYALSVLE